MKLITPNIFVRRGVRALIMGPPGSGKGTVSARIQTEYNVAHLSAGDLLRRGVNNETEHGVVARRYMNEGKLVPDDIMKSLVFQQLEELPHEKHWLLDGFPRTVQQAVSLEMHQTIDTVIYLDVPFDTIKQRLSGRWTHLPSGRVYNEEFNPPLELGYDDVTGEPLVQRHDDKPETIQQRLTAYENETKPLLEFYRERNSLTVFKGTKTDEIWPEAKEYLRSIITH